MRLLNADYIFIATPTNYDENNNSFDTSSGKYYHLVQDKFNATIIIKSTIPVGFTEIN